MNHVMTFRLLKTLQTLHYFLDFLAFIIGICIVTFLEFGSVQMTFDFLTFLTVQRLYKPQKVFCVFPDEGHTHMVMAEQSFLESRDDSLTITIGYLLMVNIQSLNHNSIH